MDNSIGTRECLRDVVMPNISKHIFRYPAFFESRLGDGLQMSFIFMQSMSQSFSENSNSKVQTNNAKGKSDDTSLSYARLGVSRIYKVIRGNRMSRNKFMSSIVSKFDSPGWHNSVVPFLIYCTEILSLLPFALPEEPLYLIYAINRVLQVRSGAVESNMKAFLHKLQEQNCKEPANGILQHEPFAQPIPNENSFVDDNRQVDQEFPKEICFTHAVPVETDQHSMIPEKPIIISEYDLPNIQVAIREIMQPILLIAYGLLPFCCRSVPSNERVNDFF